MLLLLLCIFALFSIFIFMEYRESWIFKKRTNVLKSSLKKYENLLTHDQMLYKFYIWDIEKLKRINEER